HRRVNTTTIYVTHDQEEAMTLGDRGGVMKDGLIQQADSPLVTSDPPVNRFVAGFVGTPPLNFLAGKLERAGDRPVLPDGAARPPIAAAHVPRLTAHAGAPVTLGIRPEALAPGNGPAVLRAAVLVVEPLGDRMDVHLNVPPHKNLTCRIDARQRVAEGET